MNRFATSASVLTSIAYAAIAARKVFLEFIEIVAALRIVATCYLLTLFTQNLPALNSELFLLLGAKSSYP